MRIGDEVRVFRGPHSGAYGKRAVVVTNLHGTLLLRLTAAGIFLRGVDDGDVVPVADVRGQAAALVEVYALARELREAVHDHEEAYRPLNLEEVSRVFAILDGEEDG